MSTLPKIAMNKTVYDRYMGLPLEKDLSQLTYVWIDGTGEFLRAKTRTHYEGVKSAAGKINSIETEKYLIDICGW